MDHIPLQWWGYLHSNGTIQCKRWMGDHRDYTDDVADNDFVKVVSPPFNAPNREEALAILTKRLKPCQE